MTAPLQPHASGAIALSTRALTQRFGACTALDGVTLDVAPGSVHALLGDNGAGKSSLAHCIAGFARPDAGRILVDGRPCSLATPTAARARGIAMVHQHPTLMPGRSVAENLLPPGTDAAHARAVLLAFLATTPFSFDLDATPATLSAAERQVLEVLKQLCLRPRLLVLDEPTALLAPVQADLLLSHVRALARRGACTVLLITHRLRELSAYADDVTVLRHGHRVYSAAVNQTAHGRMLHAMLDDSDDGVSAAVAGTRADRMPTLKLAA